MDNNISFGGAFVINYKRAIPNLREYFERTAFAHGSKQVFENYRGDKNKVLYVLKDSRDYDVAQFIRRNEMKFEYMPEINTKLCLNPWKEQEAYSTIDSVKPKIINKMSDLMKFVEEFRLKIKSEKCPSIGRVDRVLKALKIVPEVKKVFDGTRGVTRYIDKAKNGEIIISPKGEYGKTFVYYKPSNRYENPSFYEVDHLGENVRQLKTVDEILEFRKKFNDSVKMYIGEKKAKAN